MENNNKVKSVLKHWALYGPVNILNPINIIYVYAEIAEPSKGLFVSKASSLSHMIKEIEKTSAQQPFSFFHLFGAFSFDTEENRDDAHRLIINSFDTIEEQSSNATLRDVINVICPQQKSEWYLEDDEHSLNDFSLKGFKGPLVLREAFKDGKLLDEYEINAPIS